MPKKVKEKEIEVDVTQQPKKKETFVVRWFRDYAVNNAQELKIVCDLTSRSAEEQFHMRLTSGNTEVYAVVFYATFMTLLEFIKSKQKIYKNFTVEVCNSINIGYTNNDDDENEKVGNFMPIMEYIGINRNIVDTDDSLDAERTTNNFLRWKALNIKQNVTYYKEVQERAYERLQSEYKVNIRTSEGIIPLFCIFLDHITNVLKMKYREAEGTDVSEVSMNVLGLFDVYYSYSDEDGGKEYIEFQPNITMKLALKSDDVAMGDK